jgi:hypothetical protein
MQLSPHFDLNEMTIRQGKPGADADKVTRDARRDLERLAAVLELVRTAAGKPLHITSGYRHGDPRQHGRGQAADVQVRGMSPLDLLRVVRQLHDAGRIRVRQGIAESLHTDPDSLTRPMEQGSGLWVHIAIHGPGYDDDSAKRWMTSIAPVSGSRTYPAWSP